MYVMRMKRLMMWLDAGGGGGCVTIKWLLVATVMATVTVAPQQQERQW